MFFLVFFVIFLVFFCVFSCVFFCVFSCVFLWFPYSFFALAQFFSVACTEALMVRVSELKVLGFRVQDLGLKL